MSAPAALLDGAPSSSELSHAALAEMWRASLPTDEEVRQARNRLHVKAATIAVFSAISYWALVIADGGLLVRFVAAAGLVLSLFATATSVMHDANHGAFSSRQRINRLVGYTADLLGLSSWLWKFKHNKLHHGNTNVVGFDSDISQAPFARLAEAQPWRGWHRAQHVYIWLLYGFMALKSFLLADFINLHKRRIGDQDLPRSPSRAAASLMFVGKLAHLGWAVVIPMLFNPWWAVVAFYLACSWLLGFLLAVTFQLAHCVDIAQFAGPATSRRGDDFVAHQLRTTVNIAAKAPVVRYAFRWLVGGLDHQIEHHLAPRLPHTIYPLVGARFRQKCRAAGATYLVHNGVWTAVVSHTRWLRRMARAPARA